MLDSEALAQKIMAACAEHGYVTARCASAFCATQRRYENDDHPCIIVWSETATEHIGAMIEAYAADEIDAMLKAAIPPDMDAHGLAEAHGKLNPELGMPESRGNVETGTLRSCPCPACGKAIENLSESGWLLHQGLQFHCDHCNARLRVEYATVTLSEEAGRANR